MGSYPRTVRPLLIVGSVAIDRIATPVAVSKDILGGSASYAALAASFFAPVRLVGVVGGDFKPAFIKRLKRRRIDLEGLQVEKDGKTFFWSGEYGENFNRCATLEIQLNVFENFHPRLPDSYRDSPFVMLGAIHPALQMEVLDQVRGNPFVLADTRDLWIEITHPDLLKLIRRVDLFVLNDDEAALLTQEKNMILAGQKLRRMGPRIVVIKKGEHGSLLFHPDGLFALPAYPVKRLHDPTGAGDSYAGALIGHLARTNRTDPAAIRRAVGYATACASLTVESFGCDRLERAGRHAIEKRFRELREITRLPA